MKRKAHKKLRSFKALISLFAKKILHLPRQKNSPHLAHLYGYFMVFAFNSSVRLC